MAEIEALWQQAGAELRGASPIWHLPARDRRQINCAAHAYAPRAWQAFRLLLALRLIVARQADPELHCAEFLRRQGL